MPRDGNKIGPAMVQFGRGALKHPGAEQSVRFERAVLPHLDSAYNLARWLVRDVYDAQDVVQEAYLRALKFFDGFHGEDGRSWLLAIVRNTSYDWLRKNRRSGPMIEHEGELDSLVDETPSAEAMQLRDVDRQLIQDCLERLPPEYREVLVLRELEEMSYKQIAGVTELPIGTVMSRLARGRKRMQSMLTGAAK
jgi:RNA polymerase sigma-70 factor (ECF subfamily)